MKRSLEGSMGSCDVTAVVLDTQPVRSVRTRSGENVDCCVAFLGDQSLQYVQLSFWRTHAFNAAARIAVGDVIHTTSLRRSEFQGAVSLNSTAQTAVRLLCRNGSSGTLDSQVDESARSLLQWAKLTFPAITRQLQTYSAWQCSSFQDLSHAAFISISATMVSSEILVDDHGNHATLVISDPVRHRTIMHEVIPRIGVRFHWRNLVCERRYDEWRLHATPHTTADTVSNENIPCSDATHGSDTAKDSVLTPLDGECQSSHRERKCKQPSSRCVMSVVEAHQVLSAGGSHRVEMVDIRCSELACFVEGVDPAVLVAAADSVKCAQSLCTTDDTGKWSYKAGTLVLYDGPERTAGVAVHVPSDVMERIMCNIPASLVAEDLKAPPDSRFGWAHAVAATFRSLQGAQRPSLDVSVRPAAVGLSLGERALELVGIGVDRQFIVAP